MKKFENLYNSVIIESTLKPFEDYSNTIKRNGKYLQYENCHNHCLISEDSLSRTLSLMDTKDFAIITAYRGNFTKDENILRNRVLRAKLNEMHMGVHQLVGHWQEAPSGKDYKDCTPGELTDVVERSYLIVKPDDITFNQFQNTILELLTIEGETQDAAIIKDESGIYLLYNNGEKEFLGEGYTLNEIQQAYSQHIKKLNVPFVFEGIETPATNFSRQLYSKYNIKY